MAQSRGTPLIPLKTENLAWWILFKTFDSIPSIPNVMIFHVQLFLFHGKLVVWGWWLRYFRHLLMKGDCYLPRVPLQNSIFTIQLSEYPHIFPGKSFNPSPFFSGFFLSSSPFAQSAYLPSPVFRGKFPGNRLPFLEALAPSLAKSWCQFQSLVKLMEISTCFGRGCRFELQVFVEFV